MIEKVKSNRFLRNWTGDGDPSGNMIFDHYHYASLYMHVEQINPNLICSRMTPCLVIYPFNPLPIVFMYNIVRTCTCTIHPSTKSAKRKYNIFENNSVYSYWKRVAQWLRRWSRNHEIGIQYFVFKPHMCQDCQASSLPTELVLIVNWNTYRRNQF